MTSIMPELPEVENVVRGLRAYLVGRRIERVVVTWERSVVDLTPDQFAQQLEGQTIVGVGRRGKWILIRLGDGRTLMVHLRMSGRMLLDCYVEPRERYVRAWFRLDGGHRLCFSDVRKFGRLWLVDDPQRALADLGPEPLAGAFTVDALNESLSTRRARLKSLLLDQSFVAGLGNIYADEALWRARLHPLRRADTLSPVEVERLHGAIRQVLQAAIDSGGTTLSEGGYRQSDGQTGSFARDLAAYGRTDEPCPRCGSLIERIRVSQRSTHFCPRCQPAPPAEIG